MVCDFLIEDEGWALTISWISLVDNGLLTFSVLSCTNFGILCIFQKCKHFCQIFKIYYYVSKYSDISLLSCNHCCICSQTFLFYYGLQLYLSSFCFFFSYFLMIVCLLIFSMNHVLFDFLILFVSISLISSLPSSCWNLFSYHSVSVSLSS